MKALSGTIAVFVVVILGAVAGAAQQCVPGTIPVWVAKGNTVAIGCTTVALSTTPAQIGQNTLAPIVVMIPQYKGKSVGSWTLQPSADLNSTISSMNQAISDLQTAKKKDEATISSLQKEIAALQSKQAGQQSGQNQGQPDQSNSGNDFDTSQGNNPQYHPPTYHPPTYHPPQSRSGRETESSTPVYAPFEVKSKTTGLVLFRVTESSHGGRLYVFDSSGAEVASFGASESHLGGSMVVQTADGGSHAGMGFNGNTGFLQIDSGGKNLAELGPGLRSPMGLHMWNPSNAEVVALEAMPGGNGGLWIGNAKGGTAATIAPNKDGVGIYHGITAVMPLNHP